MRISRSFSFLPRAGNDAFTKLLVHGEANADGATVFVDNTGHAVTANGDAKISTAQKKFGSSSLYLDGNDHLSLADSEDWYFGTDDFTIDAWIYIEAFTESYPTLISQYTGSGFWIFQITSTGNISFGAYNGGATLLDYTTSGGGISTGQWYHVAVAHSGTNWYMFVNGVKKSLVTTVAGHNMPNIASDLWIGKGYGGARYVNGYIDELRVSKGVCRWTGNFAVPTKVYVPDVYTKLLMHMEGDNDSTTFLDSGFSGDKTLTNNGCELKTTQTKVNQLSCYFDGGSDYLSFADSEDWNFGTGDFTVEGWIYLSGSTASDLVFGSFTADQLHLQPYIAGSRWDCKMGGDANSFTDASIPTTTWMHFALVRASGVVKLFKNGVQAGSDWANSSSVDMNGVYIGRRYDGNYFTGYMDEFRISKGIARYTTTFTPSVFRHETDTYTKLLLHFAASANGLSTGKILDSSSGAKTITLNGDVKLADKTNPFGRYTAMYFDGSGDYLSLDDSADWDFGSSDFAIDFWVKRGATGAVHPIFYRGESTGNGNPQFVIAIGRADSADEKIWVYDYTSGLDLSSTNTIADINWHHVAVVRYSGTLYIYIDGVANGSQSYATSTDLNKPVWIGYARNSDGGTRNLTGYLDEIRVSNGVARWTSAFSVPRFRYW